MAGETKKTGVMSYLSTLGSTPLIYALGAVAAILAMAAVALLRDLHRLRARLEDSTAKQARMAAELESVGQMRARIEAASVAKSRFLATVSHEIRTPLNGVLGMADLMLDTPLSPEQTSYARAIKTSGEALLTLIEEILDFSRIEAGKLEVQVQPVALAPLVEGMIELLAPRAQGKNIEIAAFIDPSLPHDILTDGSRLRQILTNLAGNAVKFTEAGGVGVRVARDGRFLRFIVSDTGPGIPANRLDAIFEEFEQVDGQGSDTGGTGLGLAISRRLARLMGGDISVESVIGIGSVFMLTLPFRPSSSTLPSKPQSEVVDLDAVILAAGPYQGEYLGEMLRAMGGRCRVVATPESGLAALAEQPATLLIVDAAFGQDVARQMVLASQKAGCRRHIVLLSPYERRSFGAPGDAGFDRYLVKPVRRRSLEVQVRDWQGEDAALVTRAEEASLGEPLAGRRILIAEDNDINALLAGRLIERLGGRAVRASTGQEALTRLEASCQPGGTAFDALLCDVRMPDLDGLAVIRQWRRRETERGSAALPAIALTANAFAEDREACLEAGFDEFMSKPLDRERFVACLGRLFPRARAVA